MYDNKYRLFKDNAKRENYLKILDDKNIITFLDSGY